MHNDNINNEQWTMTMNNDNNDHELQCITIYTLKILL